jgi:hypothetical protein
MIKKHERTQDFCKSPVHVQTVYCRCVVYIKNLIYGRHLMEICGRLLFIIS